MKQLLILILILGLATSQPAHASNSAATEFRTTHVDLIYYAYSGRWHYRDLLYYKGITRLLDSYIDDLGIDEKLSPKRLRLVVDPASSAQVILAINETASHFQIGARGVLEPMLFLRALHYLVAPVWRPFPRNPTFDHMTSLEEIRKHLDEALGARIGKIDLSRVTDRRFIVMHLGQLRIIYQNGALHYELAGARLAESVQDPIPTRIGDRYLLGTRHGISVYESGKVIAKYDLKRATLSRPFYPVAASDGSFIDFHAGDEVALIYSRTTQTFYPIRLAAPRGWPPGRNTATCEDARFRHICAARALERFGFFVVSHDAG